MPLGTSHGIDPGAGCSTWNLPSNSGEESNIRNRYENLSPTTVRDEHNSQLRDTMSTNLPGAPRLGVVQKIHLKNFMCHSSMEITLNPHINLIVGRNGCGKSAIITALIVGLGGSAFTTKRGSSLKQFIKNGTSKATIEITLNNAGRYAYKEEVFGEKIIVTRKLTENGSSYKIKGSNGNVIYTKREQLNQITSFMNIQVDNPITVLNQNTASLFLDSSKSHEKYQLFMRATQLESLWDINFKTIENKRKAVSMLRKTKAALEVTKTKLDVLELKWNQAKVVQRYREKINHLRATLNWVAAAAGEDNLKVLQNRKTILESLIVAVQLAIENQASQEKRLNEQVISVEGRIQDFRENANSQKKAYLESTDRVARCKEAYVRKLELYKVQHAKVLHLSTQICLLRIEISELQHGNVSNHAEWQQQLQREVATQENMFQEMINTQKNVDSHLAQLRTNENKYEEERNQNRAELLLCSRKVVEIKDQIASMQSNTLNPLAVYGRLMPILVQQISEAIQQGKFRQMPVGPVGAYIQVKDKTWAPAIENFLGDFLNTFCVDNPHDHRELAKIVNSVYGEQRKPSIIAREFYLRVHNVSKFAVHAPHGMSSMLDALIVSDPIIANCLIDERELECILLIPTLDEAIPLMRERQVVPRNCKTSITKHGEQLYPDPGYRVYCGEASYNAQYLQVYMADSVGSKQDELANIEMRRNALEAEANRLIAVLNENNVEIVKYCTHKIHLQQAIPQLAADIRALIHSEDPVSARIATIQASLVETSNIGRGIKEEVNILNSESEYLRIKMEEAKDESVTLYERARILQGRDQPLYEELNNVHKEIRVFTFEKRSRAQRLNYLQEELKVTNEHVAQQQNVSKNAFNLATEYHEERIVTQKTPTDLERQIQVLERVIESVERSIGEFDETGTDLNEMKTKYNNDVSTAEKVNDAITNLDNSLIHRQIVYTKIQNNVSQSVNQKFAMLLCGIGFTGEVIINHLRQELVINVQPSHRNYSDNPTSLSGDERSYSMLQLMIALWDVAYMPFYSLDEFDGFMDEVTRRRTLEILINQAKEKKSQLICITQENYDLSSVDETSNVSTHVID